jgi:hypothetical protein
MTEQLLQIYEAQIQALQQELELTRRFIYRDYHLNKQIAPETTQDLINEYIKRKKEEEL